MTITLQRDGKTIYEEQVEGKVPDIILRWGALYVREGITEARAYYRAASLMKIGEPHQEAQR